MGLVSRMLDRLGLGGTPRDFVLKRMPKGAVCAEIGVHKGDFARRILQVARPRRLHLVDPWRYHDGDVYEGSWYGGWRGEGQARMDARYRDVLDRFDAEIEEGRVQVHRMTSLQAADRLPKEGLDWVYIDANHLYEHVLADLRTYLPLVQPGGYIAGDDYDSPGWWDDGVTRAVDEFVDHAPVEVVEIRDEQYVLRKVG